MSVQIAWPSEAPLETRVRAALAIARAFASDRWNVADRCRLEAAMTLAATDPAPRVRLTLAEAVGTLPNAPVQVIAQLATDRPDIAGLVLARSPVVTEDDLTDLVPRLDPRVLPVIAARVRRASLAALLVEIGDAGCAAILLKNPSVALQPHVLERIADRHGHDPDVRGLLLAREELPTAARYVLVDRLCSVLSATGLVSNVLGERRGRAILEDAQGAALMRTATGRTAQEVELLVDEVSERGGIDAAMLMRALCHGETNLFIALVSRISGIGPARVRSVLRSLRTSTLKGLFERCDVTPEIAALLAQATVSAFGKGEGCGLAERTALVLETCKPVCRDTGALIVLVRRWHVDALRRGGVDFARGLAKAA